MKSDQLPDYCMYINEEILKRYGIIFKKSVKRGKTLSTGFPIKALNIIGDISNTETIQMGLTFKELYEKCTSKKIRNNGLEEFDGYLKYKSDNDITFIINSKELKLDPDCIGKLLDYETKHNPKVIIFGKKISEKTIKVGAIFLAPEQFNKPGVNRNKIPVCIPGLERILFPSDKEENRGFLNPKKAQDYTVPKIILVKGAPGTGKTTMAIQMLISMARSKFNCVFWSTNNDLNSIQTMASLYEFCSKKEFNKLMKGDGRRISIRTIGLKSLPHLQIKRFSNNSISKNTNVLFIDSLNISDENIKREQIWELFQNYKKYNILTFIFLEDYLESCTNKVKQINMDCEFLSDVVIQLSEKYRLNYHTWEIKITKKHYGPQTYGWHQYKICKPGHGLSNLDKSKGIVVYPSIHRYLSGLRHAIPPHRKENYVHSGITHLDEIFQGEKGKITTESMPPDSCIVIRGIKGGHKLPLGLNLLLGGLWKVSADNLVVADKDVLIILLDEEANIDIPKAAIAKNSHLFTSNVIDSEKYNGIETLDNSNWIKWVNNDGIPTDTEECESRKKECKWQDICKEVYSSGKKVFFKKFCARIGEEKEHSKVVVAGFRPGCITPEEFLRITSKLIDPENTLRTGNPDPIFSRVLFISTAHLNMRFPLLDSEKLFLPALVDLFKSQRIISIFIDVVGEGSNKNLTYGLSALADYLIHVDEFSKEEKSKMNIRVRNYRDIKNKIESNLEDKSKGYYWSKVQVENVRGKEYLRPYHTMTVRPEEDTETNRLYLLNYEDTNPFKVEFSNIGKT